MNESCRAKEAEKDWAGNWISLAGLWGLPAVAMLVGALLAPLPRAIIWSTALVWMGGACIANARRCGRTHCRFTGPFYLLMAALVAVYAAGTLPIGEYGWAILGTATVVGTAVLWWGSERIWGLFWPRRG
jgi:hypothetical protein